MGRPGNREAGIKRQQLKTLGTPQLRVCRPAPLFPVMFDGFGRKYFIIHKRVNEGKVYEYIYAFTYIYIPVAYSTCQKNDRFPHN